MRNLTSMVLAVLFWGGFTGLIWGGFTGRVLAQSALERLEKDLDGLPAKEAPASAPDDETGYLGILADEDGKGVRIVEVIVGGPAAQARLKAGDLVSAIEGKKVATMDDFAKAVGPTRAGGVLQFEVERNEKHHLFEVTLGHRPPPVGRVTLPQAGALPNADLPMGLLGVVVDEVTPDVQKVLGVSEARGAVVLRFVPGSAAEQAGVPLEAVIVAVDGLAVDSPNDLRRLVAQAGPGSEITLSFESDGQLMKCKVRLAKATAAPPPMLARPVDQETLGEPDDESAAERIDRLERRVVELETRILQLERLLRAAEPAPRSNKNGK